MCSKQTEAEIELLEKRFLAERARNLLCETSLNTYDENHKPPSLSWMFQSSSTSHTKRSRQQAQMTYVDNLKSMALNNPEIRTSAMPANTIRQPISTSRLIFRDINNIDNFKQTRDDDRLQRLPGRVAKRSGSIYTFVRRDEADAQDMFVASTSQFEDSRKRSRTRQRRNKRKRSISPEITRGRSQTVTRELKKNKITVEQGIEVTEETKKFMEITNIINPYIVYNIEDFDDGFNEAVQDIDRSEAVGLDAEYHHCTVRGINCQAPSYVQFGLSDKCYVFNMAKMAGFRRALERIWDLCASSRVLKVGHSVKEDLRRIFEFLEVKHMIYRPKAYHVVDIKEGVFLKNPKHLQMSLSDLSHRFLGKLLRKNQKSISVGGKPALTNELEIEYVTLDALVPLHIYKMHRHIMNKDYVERSRICKGSSFLIDWPIWPMLENFVKHEPFKMVKKMPNYTHEQAIKYFQRYPDHVLVTHDKYLLDCYMIKHKIPAFNTSKTVKAMKAAYENSLGACISRRPRGNSDILRSSSPKKGVERKGSKWYGASLKDLLLDQNFPCDF